MLECIFLSICCDAAFFPENHEWIVYVRCMRITLLYSYFNSGHDEFSSLWWWWVYACCSNLCCPEFPGLLFVWLLVKVCLMFHWPCCSLCLSEIACVNVEHWCWVAAVMLKPLGCLEILCLFWFYCVWHVCIEEHYHCHAACLMLIFLNEFIMMEVAIDCLLNPCWCMFVLSHFDD